MIPPLLVPGTLRAAWSACLEIWAYDPIAKGWPLMVRSPTDPTAMVDIFMPGRHFPQEPIVGKPANDNNTLCI